MSQLNSTRLWVIYKTLEQDIHLAENRHRREAEEHELAMRSKQSLKASVTDALRKACEQEGLDFEKVVADNLIG